MIETVLTAGVIGAVGSAIAMIIKAAFSRNQNKKDQQDHEENLLKIAATMNGVSSSLDGFRKEMTEGFKEVNDKIDSFRIEQKDVNIALLRHNITSTYEDFKGEGKMPNIVFESTMSLYDNYKQCGGNSFVDEEVQEMKRWEKY